MIINCRSGSAVNLLKKEGSVETIQHVAYIQIGEGWIIVHGAIAVIGYNLNDIESFSIEPDLD